MRISRIAVLSLALLGLAAGEVQADIIDRILAVVGRDLITLSDVSAAIRLGLVPAPREGTDPVRAALDLLIVRQLELSEANRYQPAEPAAASIEERLVAIKARLAGADAAGILPRVGLTEEQLRLRLRDDLRIEAYIEQRFGALRQPSDQEISDYYRAHIAEFTTGAGVRTLAEARQPIRARLAAAHRATQVAEWLEGLRRRTEIAELYISAK